MMIEGFDSHSSAPKNPPIILTLVLSFATYLAFAAGLSEVITKATQVRTLGPRYWGNRLLVNDTVAR